MQEAKAEMALEVRRRRQGAGERAIEIIDVAGRLDAPGAAMLRTTVQKALKEGSARIAINLVDCVEIHREMMGTFHSLGRACQRAGGGFVLFGQKDDVYEYIRRFADKRLAPWHELERDAILALGGVIEPEKEKGAEELAIVVALGANPLFRGIFWKLNTLGGRPVAKFDSIASSTELLARRPIHSLIVDTGLGAHELAQLVRQIRANSRLRGIGIFPVGPPSQKTIGRTLEGEGADRFVPLVFNGEEIAANLDTRAFFARLKDAYDRFDAQARGREISESQ